MTKTLGSCFLVGMLIASWWLYLFCPRHVAGKPVDNQPHHYTMVTGVDTETDGIQRYPTFQFVDKLSGIPCADVFNDKLGESSWHTVVIHANGTVYRMNTVETAIDLARHYCPE